MLSGVVRATFAPSLCTLPSTFTAINVTISVLEHGYAGQVELAKVGEQFLALGAGLRVWPACSHTCRRRSTLPTSLRAQRLAGGGALAWVSLPAPPSAPLTVPDMATRHGPIESWLDRYTRES